MDINRYYRHSGTVTFHGLLFMLLLGTVTSICLPVIYGYCLQVIPYIWIRLFLTCVVALAVGALIGLSARLGKVRNPLLASALGLLFGLLAEYVGWVAWLYAFSGQQALIFSPDEIYTIMKEIAGTGLWSFHGFAPKGATLFMVWGIEALIIIIPAAAIPFTMIGIPYCETCS
ncbi:MAG: hypothetical protein GY765_19340, partial [bacterium]|nr:hypothetical protein [bacterium]